MGSLMVGPIVAGPMADHVGWRSFWWLNVGMLGLALLMVAFMFPETKWHRLHPSEIGPSSVAVPRKKTAVDYLEDPHNRGEIQQVATATETTAGGDLETIPSTTPDPYLGKGSPNKAQ